MEYSTWGYRKDDGTSVYDYEVREWYREFLDECFGTVDVAGLRFDTSRLLEEADPIAFHCGVADYWDSLLADGEYVEDIADVDGGDDA